MYSSSVTTGQFNKVMVASRQSTDVLKPERFYKLFELTLVSHRTSVFGSFVTCKSSCS